MGDKNEEQSKPLPGWYDDPGSDDLLCYWDGEKFTDQFKPKPVSATSRTFGNITVFSFVLGLVSFFCAVTPAYGVSFLFAIPALILGIVALARRKKPFWMSLSGLIASALGWLVSIVVAAVVAASSLHPAPVVPNSQSAPNKVAPEETTAPVEPAAPVETLGQANAKAKAERYLEISAFSRSGLIDQLEFEGFTSEESTYGVDALGVDWNQQAAAKAKRYLELSAFSRSGLVDQLLFEGFSESEAEYGVSQNGY